MIERPGFGIWPIDDEDVPARGNWIARNMHLDPSTDRHPHPYSCAQQDRARGFYADDATRFAAKAFLQNNPAWIGHAGPFTTAMRQRLT